MFEKYTKFNKEFHVQSDLKGKHKEHCLCYSCDLFHPENTLEFPNCYLAQGLFQYNINNTITTPVWECGDFIEKVK